MTLVRHKESFIVSPNVKFVYQKENKIITALEHLFPDLKIDELISLSCYDDEIVKTCFENHFQKIKNATILGIIDNTLPISNYKRMLLYCYFKQIKQTLTKLDDFMWNLLEHLLHCKIIIIEKNLLPSRKDNPSFKYHLDNLENLENIKNSINENQGIKRDQEKRIVYLLFDPTTFEYYPITSLE